MSGPPRKHLFEKFWSKVEARGPDDCWPWRGGTIKRGYGKIAEGGRGGRTLGAHVVSLMLASGELPHGRLALHSCDNPGCVNANHLRWGTKSDNARDAVARGQHFTPFRKVLI
jgi:hypothetical protein